MITSASGLSSALLLSWLVQMDTVMAESGIMFVHYTDTVHMSEATSLACYWLFGRTPVIPH